MAATLKSALQKDLALTGTKFYAWLVQGCPDIQIGTPFNPFAEEPVAADHDRAQPNRVLLVEVPQMMHMATMSTPYHGAYTSPQYTKCPVTGKSAVHAVQATLAVIFHAQASGRAPDIRTLTPSTIATVLYKDFSLCRRQVAQELVRYFATDLARELSKVFGDESALISSLRAEAERSTYLDNAYHRIDKYAPQAVHQWGQLQEKNFMIHRRRLTQALGVSNRTKKHLRSSSDDQSAADAPKVAATNRNTIPLRTSGRSARNPNPIPQSGLQSAPQPGPQSGVPLPQSGAPPPQSGAPAVVLAARVPVVHRDPNIDPALYLITSPSAFEQRLATQPVSALPASPSTTFAALTSSFSQDVVNSAEMQEMIMNMPEAGNEEQASESDQSSARRQRTRL